MKRAFQDHSEDGGTDAPVAKHSRYLMQEEQQQASVVVVPTSCTTLPTENKENLIPGNPRDMVTKPDGAPPHVEEDYDPETCFNAERDSNLEASSHFYPDVFKSSFASSSISTSYVTVTDSLGCSRRLAVKSNREMERLTLKASSALSGQLLFVPFHKLREAVEEKRYKQLMGESQVLADSLCRDDATTCEKQPLDTREEEKSRKGGVLWSEKYSPKHFTDLLSDDGINRTVLSWLKLWDETVFGTTSLLMDHRYKQDKKKGRGLNHVPGGGPAGKKFKSMQWEVQDPEHFGTEQALDETRRPKQKVFLLCGPPGLGKTTLAHIVARHAGYNVVEVNASDDRSPDVFKRVLESSTEMKAVLTASSKPNCLVIDEIDGAPATAINVLVDVIKARNKATKSSKKSKTVLSRPIICICNDLYTPSLRTLRQCATVIPVPPTISSRLSARLLEICKQEGMSASSSVLMTLCEKTDNDIRTCLNTLQFIHGRHGSLSTAAVQNASIGTKDTRKSHLTFLKDIFKLPTVKTKTPAPMEEGEGLYSNIGVERNSYQSQRFMKMLSSAYNTGEYEKVLQGIYENYLEAKVRDPDLDIMSGIQDWIMFNELLNTEVMSSQEYILMAYLPFLSVAFHFNFASSSGHRVKFPHSDFEAVQSYQRSHQLLSSLVSDATPLVRRNLSAISSADFIPLLLQIITPSFRPVNPQLYSKWEKQILSDVISTMISYNLTFHQEQTPEGQYTYVMDPNIEQLCSYSSSAQKKQLPYITKQMLAREIELERVKSESRPLNSINLSGSSPEPHPKGFTSKELLNKPIKVTKQKCQRDFFGRVVVPKTVPEKSASGDNEECKEQKSSVLSTSLWFKFNQGFSDAVKRPVRIKDLL